MALVQVFSPETEADVVTIVALLEAHDVPCFVHSAGIGSLLPGTQVPGYNTRAIMVPEERAADALELLKDFQSPTAHVEPQRQPLKSRLRLLLETILFGWFVPGSRARHGGERKDLDPG
jgi:putative signal transducing protein